METLTFKTTIQAPVENVYKALCDPHLFQEWTSVFNPVTYTWNGWESETEEFMVGFSYPQDGETDLREPRWQTQRVSDSPK